MRDRTGKTFPKRTIRPSNWRPGAAGSRSEGPKVYPEDDGKERGGGFLSMSWSSMLLNGGAGNEGWDGSAEATIRPGREALSCKESLVELTYLGPWGQGESNPRERTECAPRSKCNLAHDGRLYQRVAG